MRTTTGERPKHEIVSLYSKKIGELVVETMKKGATVEEADQAPSVKVSSAGEELDLSIGQREFYDAAGAEEALAPMFDPLTPISKIKFSTKSFGQEAAQVACRAMQASRDTLVDADISDVIAGRPEDVALEALGIMAEGLRACALRHVNVSDNALGEKGIRKVASIFTQQRGLESITLENVGLSTFACKALDELLGSNARSLKRIHLQNNMSGDEGGDAIGSILLRAPVMEDFKMVYCRVGETGGTSLCRGLAISPHLVKLNLTGNPMGPGMAEDLALAIGHQQNLKSLLLGDTLLEDHGVANVCAALARTAPHLEELDLSLNEITPRGSAVVARCLFGKASLRRLILRENELKDKGVLTICRALGGTPLVELDFAENQIRGPGALAVARIVAAKQTFQRLELNGNWIPEDVVDQVRAVLAAGAGHGQDEDILGDMDDNDEDMAESDEEEDDEDDDQLVSGMAGMGV